MRVLSVLSIAHDIHCADINATDQGGINLIQERPGLVFTLGRDVRLMKHFYLLCCTEFANKSGANPNSNKIFFKDLEYIKNFTLRYNIQ